ncbi:YadA-like family protein [Croceibacterium ferulae]|uniref:YadA-like family protein n=1 Tax=Croceibacterium ferulae TaxID=1854641 RepID=UPI00139023B4|nr:YadA-like family protein [Croceibacterium ferulae]
MLSSAAAGDPITLQVLGTDGTIIGPSDQCVTTSDAIALDAPAGIAIGGNRISGLGANAISASRAFDIDSIALGNNALAVDGATASIALGANARATAANSIAVGAGSQALRGALGNYSAVGLAAPQNSTGEFSVGADGALRQVTNVAAGSAPSDAATVGQVSGVQDQMAAQLTGLKEVVVQYAGSTRDLVQLAGADGSRITNLSAGALAATSTDAVNGAQLFATDQQVAANLASIGGLDSRMTVTDAVLASHDLRIAGNTAGLGMLDTRVAANFNAITSVDTRVLGNADAIAALTTVAVQYDSTAHDLLRLAGNAGTRITNLAAGQVAAGSTDAVNGGQLSDLGTRFAMLVGPLSSLDLAAGIADAGLLYGGRNFGDVQAVVNAIETSLSNLTVGGVDQDSPYFNTNSDGADSQALATDSVAIGPDAIAAAEGSLAAGRGAKAWSNSSVAIGDGSVAASGRAVVIGYANQAAGDGAVALGRDNEATGIGAVGLGDSNIITGDGAVGIGQRNRASGMGAVAIGNFNIVAGDHAIAIGDGHQVDGLQSLALGFGNVVTGEDALAIGSNVTTDGVAALAIGNGSRALGLHTLAFGNGSHAAGQKATALGVQAVAVDYATAIGERAEAGLGAAALGAASRATALGSVALGIGSQAVAEGSVALGASSLAERGAQANYAAFGMGTVQTSAGEIAIARTSPNPIDPGAFPLGERQITGVAAGSSGTDAVNVAQLRGVAGNLGTAMAASLGGGATYDSTTGTLSAASYNVAGTTYGNVGEALAGLATQVGAAAAAGVAYDTPLRERVTLAGTAGTVIANVGAGTVAAGSMEAVNGGQLAATNAQVSANSAAIALLGSSLSVGVGPVRYADAATPTVPNGGLASNDVTLVGADANAPVRLHNVADGTIAAGSTDAVNGGQVAAIAAAAGNAIQYDRTASGERADRVTLAGGTAGAAVTLANVANGAVDAASTQAVNGRQLAATNAALASTTATSQAALATAQQAATLGSNSVQYDSATNTVTFSHPGDFPPAAPVTLRNVAAGVELTDAVNVGQLGDAMNMSVVASTANTDMRLQQFDFRLDDLRRDAEAGTAAAMAMAQIPSMEGELTLGGGAGIWQGESAMALGLAHRTDRRRINMAATYTSRGQAGAAVGVGFALR